MIPGPVDWRSDAECLDTDPEIFYPRTKSRGPAMALCARCPVTAECLADAMAMPPLQRNVGMVRAGQYFPPPKSMVDAL